MASRPLSQCQLHVENKILDTLGRVLIKSCGHSAKGSLERRQRYLARKVAGKFGSNHQIKWKHG